MSGLRAGYLVLAIWGAAHPMVSFVQFWRAEGLSLVALVDAWLANHATSGLALELAIAGIALSIWVVAETRVRRNWIALATIPATLILGIGCGLPLYLFLRTRPIG